MTVFALTPQLVGQRGVHIHLDPLQLFHRFNQRTSPNNDKVNKMLDVLITHLLWDKIQRLSEISFKY